MDADTVGGHHATPRAHPLPTVFKLALEWLPLTCLSLRLSPSLLYCPALVLALPMPDLFTYSQDVAPSQPSHTHSSSRSCWNGCAVSPFIKAPIQQSYSVYLNASGNMTGEIFANFVESIA